MSSPNNLQEPSWYGSSNIVLAPNAKIADSELTTAGNYAGASLTITRNGGANSDDVFANTGTLGILNQGSYFSVDSVTIGRVTTNSNGTLTLTFNSNATQALVDKALQQITFKTAISDAPPASIKLDWTFNDGNTGSQGTGGAKSVTTSLIVNIEGVNDAPVSHNLIQNKTVSVNNAFNIALPTGAFTDPDVVDTLTYSLTMSDGSAIPPWLSINSSTGAISGTPDSSDVGNLSLRITAKDSAGATASDDFSLAVKVASAAPTKAFLIAGKTTTIADNATVFGSSGYDIIQLEGSARINSNVEKIVLSQSFASYQLSIQGTHLTLTDTNDSIIVGLQSDNDGTRFDFNGTEMGIKLIGLGLYELLS